MAAEEAALLLHDSEQRIEFIYLQLVDDATRVLMAEGLARKWAKELTDKRQQQPARPEAVKNGEPAGGEL
jgi:hypothetical protein